MVGSEREWGCVLLRASYVVLPVDEFVTHFSIGGAEAAKIKVCSLRREQMSGFIISLRVVVFVIILRFVVDRLEISLLIRLAGENEIVPCWVICPVTRVAGANSVIPIFQLIEIGHPDIGSSQDGVFELSGPSG